MRSSSLVRVLLVCGITTLAIVVAVGHAQQSIGTASTDLMAVTLITGDHANARDVMERSDQMNAARPMTETGIDAWMRAR
jgi:hypothetical protein